MSKTVTANIGGTDVKIEVKELDLVQKMELMSDAPDGVGEMLVERGSVDAYHPKLIRFMETVVVETTPFTEDEYGDMQLDEAAKVGAAVIEAIFGEDISGDVERRQKRIDASFEFIEQLFTGKCAIVAGVPDDAKLDNLRYDPERDSVVFVFSHDGWEPLNEGEEIPLIEPAWAVDIGSSMEEI